MRQIRNRHADEVAGLRDDADEDPDSHKAAAFRKLAKQLDNDKDNPRNRVREERIQ